MRVEYHPDTVLDLNQAVDYYESQSPGLGQALRDEIYQTIQRITANPFAYRPVSRGVRRCFVHRFPFSILYRIPEDDCIRILVIRHHRQHWSFGKDRR